MKLKTLRNLLPRRPNPTPPPVRSSRFRTSDARAASEEECNAPQALAPLGQLPLRISDFGFLSDFGFRPSDLPSLPAPRLKRSLRSVSLGLPPPEAKPTPNRCKRLLRGLLFLALLAVWTTAFGAGTAAPPPEAWPPERIDAALRALDRMKTDGLITDRQWQRKRAMLEERRAGRFKSTALSTTDPAELNFLQNAGFEEVNKNSARNRSRWLWWGGWSWGGDYENFWETRPSYVHSGTYSAGIRCTGKAGRIGLNTPKLPVVPGVKEYEFSLWAKGEGENQLFLNFESGATGSLRQKIGPNWEQVKLKGRAEPDAKGFGCYIYVTGQGTIWLDDAKLIPLGEMTDE